MLKKTASLCASALCSQPSPHLHHPFPLFPTLSCSMDACHTGQHPTFIVQSKIGKSPHYTTNRPQPHLFPIFLFHFHHLIMPLPLDLLSQHLVVPFGHPVWWHRHCSTSALWAERALCVLRSQTPSSLGVCRSCPGTQPPSAPHRQSHRVLRPPLASPRPPVPHPK